MPHGERFVSDHKRDELRNYFPSYNKCGRGNCPGNRPKYKNWGQSQEYPKTGNIIPKHPHNTATGTQPIRRTLHTHIVERYIQKGVALKRILTPIRIRQSCGMSLLMAGLLHVVKGSGASLDIKHRYDAIQDNWFPLTTKRYPNYGRAYQIQEDSQTQLEVRASTFIQ